MQWVPAFVGLGIYIRSFADEEIKKLEQVGMFKVSAEKVDWSPSIFGLNVVVDEIILHEEVLI